MKEYAKIAGVALAVILLDNMLGVSAKVRAMLRPAAGVVKK